MSLRNSSFPDALILLPDFASGCFLPVAYCLLLTCLLAPSVVAVAAAAVAELSDSCVMIIEVVSESHAPRRNLPD